MKQWSWRRGVVVAVVAGLAATLLTAAAPAVAAGVAPGAPGSPSYFDLARKDCVGTARDGSSKVWFTVAGGVLSDVYEPTIDNTNVKTLQYVVTDGATFTDVQSRDLTYTVTADPTGMTCTVTATSTAHGYRLVSTYLTDPARDAVVVHTRFEAVPGGHADLSRLRVYAHLDAHLNGNGAGAPRTAARIPGWSTVPVSA